jgi:hypothetical protein
MARVMKVKPAKRPRRISFTDGEAAHIYAWLSSLYYGRPAASECPLCQQLRVRLERMIGPGEMRSINRRAIADRKAKRRPPMKDRVDRRG